LLLRLEGKLIEARKLEERAVASLCKAVKLDPLHLRYATNLRNGYLGLFNTLIGLKEHAELARRAEEMAHFFPRSAEDLYLAVALLVNAGTFAAQDDRLPHARRKELARAYDDLAINFLRQSIAAGFNDLARLKKGPVFEVLGPRADFNLLLKGLEARNQTGKK
jgi:hypothetical protein